MASAVSTGILRADSSSKLAAMDGASVITTARTAFHDGMQRVIDAPERGRATPGFIVGSDLSKARADGVGFVAICAELRYLPWADIALTSGSDPLKLTQLERTASPAALGRGSCFAVVGI